MNKILKKNIQPFSRFFRRVFEFAKIHNVFGVLVVLAICSVVVIPNSYATIQTDLATNYSVVENQVEDLKTEKSIRLPLDNFRITQGYHFLHRGVDFASETGQQIYPVMDGEIELVARDRFSYGNHIIINHGSGLRSLYAHLSKIDVKEGQKVNKNEVIGLVGSTGWSTGPHLHLQVWDENGLTNPKAFFEGYFGTKLASTK